VLNIDTQKPALCSRRTGSRFRLGPAGPGRL